MPLENCSANRIRNQPRIPNSSRRFLNCPATPYVPRVSSAPCLLGLHLRLRFRPHGLPQSGPPSLPQVPCPRWTYPRPSHRPRTRLMTLRPPARSLRRPPALFRHLPQDCSNRLPRHQSRVLTIFRTRPYGVAPMHSWQPPSRSGRPNPPPPNTRHQPNRPSVNQDVPPYQAGTRFCSETEFPNQAISIRQGISISNAVWEPCTLGR